MEFCFELNCSDIFFVIFTVSFSQMFGNVIKVHYLFKTKIYTVSQCICFTFIFLYRRNSG